MIDSTTIAINRYAPRGSQEIRLYSNGLDGGSGLTIGQLAIAVSMRSAAVCVHSFGIIFMMAFAVILMALSPWR